MNDLQDINDWVPLGLYLGIKMPRLEAIETDFLTVAKCRTQMLNEWQKKVTPTWSAVIQALEGIGMGRLASELAHKHGWLNSYSFHQRITSSTFVIPLNLGTPPPKLPENDPLDELENIYKGEEKVSRWQEYMKEL